MPVADSTIPIQIIVDSLEKKLPLIAPRHGGGFNQGLIKIENRVVEALSQEKTLTPRKLFRSFQNPFHEVERFSE